MTSANRKLNLDFPARRSVVYFVCLLFFAASTMALADGFEVGASVRCKWQRVGNFYPGRIAQRDGNRLHIQYDDGDTEVTEIQYCELFDRSQTNQPDPVTSNNQSQSGAQTIRKLEARSTNDWRDWSVELSGGVGRLTADGTGPHMSWDLELPGPDVQIVTCIQGSEWWTKWQYRYGGNQLIAEASSLTEWRIDSSYTRLNVRTRWSGDTDQWIVEGRRGSLTVTRRGGSWTSWQIEDRMPGEEFHMKMAAIFAIIVATEMPH